MIYSFATCRVSALTAEGMGWEISTTCSSRKSTERDRLHFDLRCRTSAARSSVDFWPSILGCLAVVYISALLHMLLQAACYFPQREAWDWLSYRMITFCPPIGGCFLSKAGFLLPSEHYSLSHIKETGQLFFRDCWLIYYMLSSDFFHPFHIRASTGWLSLDLRNVLGEIPALLVQ